MKKKNETLGSILRVCKMVLKTLCAFTICMLVIILTMQVVNRNFLGHSFIWVEELAGLCMVYLTFLGSALATLNDTNTRVDFFIRLFPPKVTIFFNILTDVISIVFLGLLGKLCIKSMADNMNNLSAAMKLPVSVNYLGMFAGMILMILFFMVRIYMEIEKITGKDLSVIEEAVK